MVLAHTADWVSSLGFAAPAIILVVGVGIAKLRERRRRTREDQPSDESP